jgi:hypothetical protein
VLVVAAAGNDSNARRFYPAALGNQPVPDSPLRLIGVDSLNPNQSKSLFSNDNDEWVTYWAPGASVVSTFPTTPTGSITPINATEADAPDHRPHRREALDDDDFASGFAIWSGTSFASPMVAARLAQALYDEPEIAPIAANGDPVPMAKVARERATNAIRAVRGNADDDYVWPE